jgi:hypothetical protein
MKKILIISTLILSGIILAVSSQSSHFSDEVFPWLQEEWFTSTKNPNEFRKNDYITRGEAARFLSQYSQLLEMPIINNVCQFSDLEWYTPGLKSAIIEVCEFGFFRGVNGRFVPQGTLTEQQALVMTLRSVYGMQDEGGSPWYREYYGFAQDLGLITDETIESIFTTPITREKMATWMYDILTQEDVGGSGYIYESEVDSADECSAFETYDPENSVCYFECETEDECSAIEQQIEDELAGWSEAFEENERSEESEDSIESSEPIARYTVWKWEKITFATGSDWAAYHTLWDEVSELSPDTLTDTYIDTFEVYNDAASDTLAFVVDEDGNGKWAIGINLATHNQTDVREQKSTLIHELAHIITLNNDQIDKNIWTCQAYETSEWCMKSNSYLNAFVSKFWWKNTELDYREGDFVSEYASSSPEEDIAESFAFFIIENDFSGTTTRDQKMRFFSTYLDLMKIRNDMRNVLKKDVIRMKKM